ncbi:ABC transporter ATP-binding protein [Schaalia sp. ZJ1691]|uniref:amino acid ABC transporter ATP-binding/permease protein n=1 Tax=Schaalia sp. ZJ1691 TaxID=2709404 RepID=UPI0013ED10D1|nr:ABC transporter ATP-binding protein [Schaalia sp. ZJ1691]
MSTPATGMDTTVSDAQTSATSGKQTQTSGQRGVIAWLLARTKGVRPMWTLSVSSRVINQLLMVAILVMAAGACLGAPLVPAMAWIAGLSLVKAVFRYLEHYAGHWVAFTMLAWLRTEFYDAIVPQAPAVVKGHAAAELSERATRDIDRIEVFFAHTIPPMIAAILVPTASITWVGFHLGWSYALVMAISAVFMIAGPALGRLLSWQDNRDLAATNAQIATHLGDSIQGLREVLGFGAEEQRLAQWEQAEAHAETIRRRVRRRAAVRAALLMAIELATLAALVGVVGAGDVQSALLACAAWVALWAPLRGVDDFVDGLDEALASAERVRAAIDAPPQVVDAVDASAPEVDPTAPAVSVSHVSFTYDGATDVLSDVSFEITDATWTYIVGVSGGGKSTVAALLARGWDPREGRITYRGVDIRRLRLDDLRSRVSLVVQRPSLLSASLRGNLTLSAPDAADERLWEALDLVSLGEWARSHADGLDQAITLDGSNISGGQIQRLAIARALVAMPDVLILDEAMSQLDEATAREVRSRIRLARPDLTVVEISHQVDRIDEDARVLVIDAGHLVEEGLASDLLRNEDGYLSRLARRV